MEKFIIHSKEYRNSYVQFMKYLQAIGYSKASCSTFTTGIKEFLCWLEKKKINTINEVEENDIENFYSYQQERPSSTTGGALSESRVTINMYTLKLFSPLTLSWNAERQTDFGAFYANAVCFRIF